MPRFSIVIPVYNAERTLNECLDSASGQTFTEIEIVCINDGSTDDSKSVLESHAKKDGRIRIIDQENSGPSRARNTGIEAATGDYLIFLDSDDMLESAACERISERIDSSAVPIDAVVFGWSCFDGNPNRWIEARTQVPEASYPSFEPELLFDEPVQPFLRLAVRRDALMKQGIRFDEALRVGEDTVFLFATFPQLAGVQLISDKLYRYRLPHEGSIMQEIAGDDVAECVHHLNMAVSIFGNWAKGGLLDRFREPLVAWSVKNVLYTMLRQAPAIRNEFASALGDLWKAHWTEDELQNMNLPTHVKKLIRHAINPNAPHLSRDLLSYRIAEYGPADLARTALDHL